MPYIPSSTRAALDSVLTPIRRHIREANGTFSAGELNYVVTLLVHETLGWAPNYGAYNTVLGVLEAAKLELYRRHVAPYEDQKIKQNGDVP